MTNIFHPSLQRNAIQIADMLAPKFVYSASNLMNVHQSFEIHKAVIHAKVAEVDRDVKNNEHTIYCGLLYATLHDKMSFNAVIQCNAT